MHLPGLMPLARVDVYSRNAAVSAGLRSSAVPRSVEKGPETGEGGRELVRENRGMAYEWTWVIPLGCAILKS